eukprot:COSAG01_NODE_8830_length_2646_cov_1.008245_2_plen_175_part_00
MAALTCDPKTGSTENPLKNPSDMLSSDESLRSPEPAAGRAHQLPQKSPPPPPPSAGLTVSRAACTDTPEARGLVAATTAREEAALRAASVPRSSSCFCPPIPCTSLSSPSSCAILSAMGPQPHSRQLQPLSQALSSRRRGSSSSLASSPPPLPPPPPRRRLPSSLSCVATPAVG